MPILPESNAKPSQLIARFMPAVLAKLSPVITLRRIALSAVGTFAFVGAAAALNGSSNIPSNTSKNTSSTQNTMGEPDQSSSNQPTSPSTDSSNSDSTSTSFSATTNNGQATMNLNVNGQDIPMPDNTTSHQTVTNNDGTKTTIDASSIVSTNGSATNTSSSSFSLNVNSSNSTEGGTNQ